MAFFKFRLPGRNAGKAAAQAPAESIDSLRRRARHRLIGAAVLVLIGVVGFPLLFDTQPRPVAVDIPIEIPDKAQAQRLNAPAASTAAAAPTPAPSASAPQIASATPAPPASPAVARPSANLPDEEREPVRAAVPAPAAPVAPTVTPPKPAAVAPNESARAQALLEGRRPASASTAPTSPASVTPPATGQATSNENGRFVVQVGAFSDESKAREARMKLERAGLKTYTQAVETRDGKRIRVRVGPFTGRAEADKAASRIKGLDLPAAILTL